VCSNALQPVIAAPRIQPDLTRILCRVRGVEMRQNYHVLDETDDQEAADRQTASLAGVAITLVLLVVGLFLVHELHSKGMIEDCLLAGRSNCDAVLANLP
jgi:hypothetical protein